MFEETDRESEKLAHVVQAVQEIGSLGNLSHLSGLDGIVLDTVNGIESLNGIASGGGDGLFVAKAVSRVDLHQTFENFFEKGIFEEKGISPNDYAGTSIQWITSGLKTDLPATVLQLSSFVSDQTIIVAVSQFMESGTLELVEGLSLTRADGQTTSGWLEKNWRWRF